MNLWIGLQTIFGYLRTSIAKSSNAENAEENTRPEDSKTLGSAPNVLEGKHSMGANMITKETAKRKLVDWAKSQVGYHEGYDGSNKFADGVWDVRLYGFSALLVPWCDVFVDAGFISCFGFDKATEMTYQKPSGYAACSLSADAYKRHGAFYNTPEVGDQIFFLYGGGINHTGIVIEVNGDEIVCVEGNYSDGVGRTYYKWKISNHIAGYGRPNWSVVAEDEPQAPAPDFSDVDDTQFDIVHPQHPRTYMHLEYGDGIGMPIAPVRAWQALLQCWGYILDADGEFGLNTENATRQWQTKAVDTGIDVEINGVVDEDDWEEIIHVPGGDDL